MALCTNITQIYLMVSVIISSADAAQLRQVTDNINSTIGVLFQLIAIDNSAGEKGICEVYNTGAQTAQYDILCFLHEDIIIKTNNWGQVLVDIFKNNPEIGLLGIAGSSYKSLSPSPWSSHAIDTKYTNFEQYYKHEDKASQVLYRNPKDVKLAQVACIDGVFMCTTKQVFAEYQFDEQLLKGFHIYDVDYSLTVGQKYKVAVTYDIFLSHLSEGSYGKDWMQDNIEVHKKWNMYLPVNIEELTLKQQQIVEKVSFKSFINELIGFNMPLIIAYEMLNKNNRFVKLYFKTFIKLNFYLIKVRSKASDWWLKFYFL